MEIDYNDKFIRANDDLSESINQRNFLENKAFFLDRIEFLTPDNKLLLYYNLALCSSNLGNQEDSVSYYNEGTEIISQIGSNISVGLLRAFYLNKGVSLSRLASKTEKEKFFDEAEKAFDEFVRLTIYDASGGIGARSDLYSFRKINLYSLQDLINKEITVSNPALFNDPFDCLFYHFMERVSNSYDNRALIKSFKKIRIRSFVHDRFFSRSSFEFQDRKTKPLTDILMWSHYADSHKGICVLYDFKSSIPQLDKNVCNIFFDEKYSEGEIVDISKNTDIEFELGFLKKNKCWEYEGEVRLLHFDPKCDADFIHLPLGDAKVSAIYFGLYCPPEHVDMVKKIFENTDVKFYKMKTDSTNIYNLIAEECSE